MKVNFKGWECDVSFGQYANGNTTIQLFDKNELVTVASVNGEWGLSDEVVGIKTWSENEGIVQALVDGGVIEPDLLGFELSGFVAIEHYRLTDASINEINKLKEIPNE